MKRTLIIVVALVLLISGCKSKPPKKTITITEYPTHLSITSEPIKEAE